MGMIYGSNRYTADGRRKAQSSTKSARQITKGVRSNAPEPYRRQTTEYRSAPDAVGVAPRVDAMQYTGRLVKGIGTLHKSNAIPVINQQEMIDLARMRR